MAAADLEVVRVVRRGDLDRAGAEGRVDVRVGHDRDVPAGEREFDGLADEVLVSLVVGVDRHGGVAEHGLGPRRRHHDAVVTVAVADGDQLAVVVGVVDLDVGQRGEAARAPVDDPLGAVDQPVVVQPLEDRLDGSAEPFVHGEALARPVHRVAEAAHLGQDPAAVLALPLPDAFDEGFPAEVVPGQSLLGQFALHHVLGRDPGVVHAGQPERAVALHAAAPDEDVAQRVVQRVADVQDARYVRRRQHDRVARRVGVLLGLRREVAGLLPVLVTAGLHLGRRVLRGKLVLVACCHIK